jgi:hypothetical protein
VLLSILYSFADDDQICQIIRCRMSLIEESWGGLKRVFSASHAIGCFKGQVQSCYFFPSQISYPDNCIRGADCKKKAAQNKARFSNLRLTIRRSCKNVNGSVSVAVSKPQEVVPPLLSVADEARNSFGFLYTLCFQLQSSEDTNMGA